MEDQSDTTTIMDESRPCIQDLPFLFPFSSKSQLDLHALELLENSFPSQARAFELCRKYLDHAAYFFRPIKDHELFEEMLPSVYNSMSQNHLSTNGVDVNVSYTQSLATIFFILALGTLLDLTLTPYNAEAERYYELGRASLSLHPVYDSPNFESVRSVGLMATYHSFAGKKYTRDSAVSHSCLSPLFPTHPMDKWLLMSIAAKLAQSVGFILSAIFFPY